SSPCRPRGSSPAEGSPAVIPDSESAPRTCLLSSTLIRGIMVHHCPTRRVYKKDTCLRIDLCTGTKRTLIDTNETSHPPYRGELRARRSLNHDPEQQHQHQPGDRQHCLHDRPRLDGLTHRHTEILLDEPETGVVEVGAETRRRT